jgi:hypothetical protein
VYLLYKLLIQQTSDRYFETGLYGFGGHLISNWKYFSNLVIPNPQSPPVHSYLMRTFPPWALTFADLGAGLVRVGLLVAGLTLWWKGTRDVRLWIALSLLSYLPFIAFAGGHAGPNRYFYLPSIGFSALVASGLTWSFRRVQAQRPSVIAVALLPTVVLGLWLYNLIPIRAWQKEMREDSLPVQQALYRVNELNDRRAAPVSTIYLVGFPLGASSNLSRAIRLMYGAQTDLVVAQQIDEPEVPVDTLILVYDANRGVIDQPYRQQ